MRKNKSLIFQTHSSSQTKKLAGFLAQEISKIKLLKKALVFALQGELGAGKTTFIQGFLRELGIKKRTTSPTFVLIKKFIIRVNPCLPAGRRVSNLRKSAIVYHIDCYRIKKSSELLKLGLKEILENPQNIVLIEWPEKIRRILPKNTIWIKLKHGKKINEREIKIIRD